VHVDVRGALTHRIDEGVETAVKSIPRDDIICCDFDRAIQLLRTCLEEADLAPDDQVRFYRLLSFAHIAKDEQPQARESIEQLLSLNPDCAPDDDDDTDFSPCFSLPIN